MTIDALPAAPAATDPVDVFDSKAFAFLAALTTFQEQANALAEEIQIDADLIAAMALGMALPNYAGTSTTTNTIGTGPKSFVTQSGKAWTVGQVVVLSNGNNYVKGAVTNYTGTALDVNVTSIAGSGSFSSWSIAVSFNTIPGLAESGVNNTINELAGLTKPIPRANTLSIIQSLPDPTLSANAMTLPASTHALDFRSATLTTGVPATVTGTAAAMTIPAGATLGAVSGQLSTLVEVIINNGGTLEKAVVNLAGGNDLSETGVISTTAITAGATAANVFYSTTARTNVPYRLVRVIASTQATVGQWATAPSLVQGAGGQAFAAMASLGYGQVEQNVTGSRALGTTYYNPNKPRAVYLTGSAASGSAPQLSLSLNGRTPFPIGFTSVPSGGPGWCAFAIIPAGCSYVITGNATSPSVASWWEV